MDDEYYNRIDKSKVSFTKEKTILLNVIEKQDLIKNISDIEFTTISDSTIDDLAFVLDNVLKSDIFGDYCADSIVNIASKAEVSLDKSKVLAANTWESDLRLIRTAINMNKDSFNRTTIETLLTGIEESSLLKDDKNKLLLDTARKVTMN